MSADDPADVAMAARMAADEGLRTRARELMLESGRYRYCYNLKWLGRPIIQYPDDIVALQDLIWRVQPDVVVETGIAHGGSLAFYASMLQLLGGDGFVVGVDIDIRQHNREAIEAHPTSARIKLVQGSSTAPETVAEVKRLIAGRKRPLVVLDSMHSHAHVLEELKAYSQIVVRDSYLVVLDTLIEFLPKEFYPDRPWGPGDNPYTAVQEFLAHNDRFVVDAETENRLLLTVAPRGFLRCVKD